MVCCPLLLQYICHKVQWCGLFCLQDLRTTVGNVPMEWYREFEHIGYDLLGDKIIKPPKGDQLQEFLNKMDNPDYWWV